MLSQFAKALLIGTALSPVLGAIAVNKASTGQPYQAWMPWCACAVLLVVICWGVLRYAEQAMQKVLLSVGSFERTDKEVLTFLLAYLLPFISPDNMAFTDQWLTGGYILGLLLVVIGHAGAFHFNPLMGLLGYHFYEIRNDRGVSCLLISRAELAEPGIALRVVRLAKHVYLAEG